MFDLMNKHVKATCLFTRVQAIYMQQFEWLVGTQYKPLELKSDLASVRKSPPWAIDSWGLDKARRQTVVWLETLLR